VPGASPAAGAPGGAAAKHIATASAVRIVLMQPSRRPAPALASRPRAPALDVIRRRRPDVLLADLRMPDEDGYSLISRLRALERDESLVRLPAIAVTAYASAADREHALAAGYDSHITKPVEPEELARAILRVVNAEDV